MRNLIFGSLTVLTIMTLTSNNGHARTNPISDYFSSPEYVAPKTNPKHIKGVPFDKIQTADYEAAIIDGISSQNREIAEILKVTDAPTFRNTIVPLDASGKELNGAIQTLSNLESALGDTILMNINARMMPRYSEHVTDIMLNEPLFQRVKAVYDNRKNYADLSPEDLKLIEETYRNFVESGANLEGDAREKYKRLNKELSDLQVRFTQNVTNGMADPARRLYLTKDQLSGLPQSIIDAARIEAKEALEAEGKTDDGSLYLFTVFYPSYSPLMKYADNRDVREKMYKIYSTRNIDSEYNNLQILKDIANIRLEIANLFGKKTFAEYALENKMAKNPKNVEKMLTQLRTSYREALDNELKELTEFAQASEGKDFEMKPWDYAYWSDKLKNARYSFNDEDMRPYFELENTIKGVLGLATSLYGYKFRENKNLPVYHPDVKAFEVMNSDGSLLGLLYADFYYRPGKGPGAWMTEFKGEFKDKDGNRSYPVISIVTNFNKPVGNEPSLLTPYEVETFLHEFGHALHGLSANTKYNSLSGTHVAHDFVELFSQFNENFLTEKKFLDSFAKHYKTGKKMPADLIAKLIKSSQFGAAYSCYRQLGFGELDMAYHTITEPFRASADIVKFEENALKSVKVFDAVENCLISPTFGHIFSGGYAAGYYGYKWSEELDADAFSLFKQNGIFDKKTAAKFHKMLESGGTVDPMELYIEFRGQEPSVNALLERDGIVNNKK